MPLPNGINASPKEPHGSREGRLVRIEERLGLLETAPLRHTRRRSALGWNMALILTRHARYRMTVRAIDLTLVEATVTQAERTALDQRDPAVTRAWRRIPERSGRALRVVCAVFDRGARRWLQ